MKRALYTLLTFSTAGGASMALLGLLDASHAATRVGLAPLEAVEQMTVLSLLTLMNLVVGVLLGVTAGGLVVALRRVISEPARANLARLARHPAILLTGCVTLTIAAYAWSAAKEINWSAVPWGRGASLLAAGSLGLFILVASRALELRGRLSSLLLLLGIGGLCALGYQSSAEGHEEGIGRIALDSVTGPRLLGPLRSAFDEDDDGFATRFCTVDCDCDDARASVHPTAPEVPGNGLDEDCDGADLSRASALHYEAVLQEHTRDSARPTELDVTVNAAAAARRAASLRLDQPFMRLQTQERPNLLLITVDTLRSDHMGFLGYPLPTSPNLDAWAERGVIFERVWSTGPMTKYSMGPMLVGKYYSEIKRSEEHWPEVHHSERVLAERLSDAGYHNAAFHCIEYFLPKHGFAQGFHHYDVSSLKAHNGWRWAKTSDYITDRALDYVDSGDFTAAREEGPWFLWAYYGDPHAGWLSHSDYDQIFDGRSYNDDVSHYDQEIRFTDEHVGRLLEGLEARGLLEDTLIVFHSDHGEGLVEELDHGYRWHGFHLFDETLRVPLVIIGPGIEPRRVTQSVSLLDIQPTVLDLLGLRRERGVRGVSLSPWLRGFNPDHPPVFFQKHSSTSAHMKGMVRWPWKVIWAPKYNRFRIYNLAEDPAEQRNVSRRVPPELKAELTGLLSYWANTILEEREPDVEP